MRKSVRPSKGGQLSLRPQRKVAMPRVAKTPAVRPSKSSSDGYKKAALKTVGEFSNSGFGTGLLPPGPSIVSMAQKK